MTIPATLVIDDDGTSMISHRRTSGDTLWNEKDGLPPLVSEPGASAPRRIAGRKYISSDFEKTDNPTPC